MPRQNDAESIKPGVVDSMYLGGAHSKGHARQHVNLLGYALMVELALAPYLRAVPRPRVTDGSLIAPRAEPTSLNHARTSTNSLP